MNVYVTQRLHLCLCISQCQNRVKQLGVRTTPDFLTGIKLAAGSNNQLAVVGIILPAQQVAAGFHPHIAAAGFNQRIGVWRGGGHARLRRRAGGNILDLAACLEGDVAATQRTDALLELVEAHPPCGPHAVGAVVVQPPLTEQPVGIQLLRAFFAGDVAQCPHDDVAAVLTELRIERIGKTRQRDGRIRCGIHFAGGVDRRFVVAQFDVVSGRDADIARACADQLAGGEREVLVTRLHRQRIGGGSVGARDQPVRPGIISPQRGRRCPA